VNTLDKQRRLNDLKDRETREIVASEYIGETLPLQIRELRKQRRYTQKVLGELAGVDQGSISNWENPNYDYTPQIGTLERLARAFDVPLIVRFGSWTELWDWEHSLSPERLAPKSFPESLPDLETLASDPASSTTPSVVMSGPGTGKTATFVNVLQRETIALTMDVAPKPYVIARGVPQRGTQAAILTTEKTKTA
jgi:transcriptional regulator with XRE-family HTH domain